MLMQEIIPIPVQRVQFWKKMYIASVSKTNTIHHQHCIFVNIICQEWENKIFEHLNFSVYFSFISNINIMLCAVEECDISTADSVVAKIFC